MSWGGGGGGGHNPRAFSQLNSSIGELWPQGSQVTPANRSGDSWLGENRPIQPVPVQEPLRGQSWGNESRPSDHGGNSGMSALERAYLARRGESNNRPSSFGEQQQSQPPMGFAQWSQRSKGGNNAQVLSYNMSSLMKSKTACFKQADLRIKN